MFYFTLLFGSILGDVYPSLSHYFSYQKSGTLEDSDWLEQIDQKDIYSTSDARLKLTDFSFEMDYLLNKIHYSQTSYGLYYCGIRYQDQNLDFIANNLTQTSLSDPTEALISISGDVIKYSRKAKIPFFILKSQHYFSDIFGAQTSCGILIGFSPWVSMMDADDHLIRKKLSEGNLTGSSLISQLSTDIWFSPQTCLSVGVLYQWIDASGHQIQSRYEKTSEGDIGEIANVDERLKSESTAIYANFKYQFDNIQDQKNEFIYINKEKSDFNPNIGFAWNLDSENHYAYPEFVLEKEIFHSIGLGIGYGKAYNKINNQISKGQTTQLPLYAYYQLLVLKNVILKLGSGYAWTQNQLDPQAISDLEKQGYKNAKETISDHWFGLLGIEYKLFPDIGCYVDYQIARPTIYFESDSYHDKQALWLNNFKMGIKVTTAI